MAGDPDAGKARPEGGGDSRESEAAKRNCARGAGGLIGPAHGLPVLGVSAAIRAVLELILQVADSYATILLEGPNGTGKGLLAEALHRLSLRAHGPFITVVISALMQSILESELFGFEKGAFTGAFQTRKGKFEVADGGTLFLDEIGGISPSVQVKLLRFLQERRFERVGGTESHQADVRVIAATNQDLRQLVREGKFREDLFYRLNVVPIRVPALRERAEDIPILLQEFMGDFARSYRRGIPLLTAEAMKVLCGFEWPGNVRQLQNFSERMVLLCKNGMADAGAVREILGERAALDGERERIRKELAVPGRTVEEAAGVLGIHRVTLQNKMKEYGLKRRRPH